MRDCKVIGENIDKIRKERGLTKEQLQKAMDIQSYNTLNSHIKTGRMDLNYLFKYSEVLGCTPGELFDGVDVPSKFNVPFGIKSLWPYSLIFAVEYYRVSHERYSERYAKEEYEKEAMNNLYLVHVPSFLELFNSARLTPREKKVIEMRFVNFCILDDCAREFDVTRERIRQIEFRAIRKLSHPLRNDNYKMVSINEYRELEHKFELANVSLSEAYKKIEQYKDELLDDSIDTIVYADAPYERVKIDELDLSIRSFNCLARRNIKYIDELANLHLEDLMKIRNLGKRSLNEITTKLYEKYGIVICSEEDTE